MLRFALVAVTCIAGSAGALAQELGDPARGRAYAERNCGDCHAVEPGDVHVARPGIVSFKTIANTKGMTGRALTVWLQTSHPNMPNLIVAAEDRDDLIAYILSLRDKP
jgi:cytochrome c2